MSDSENNHGALSYDRTHKHRALVASTVGANIPELASIAARTTGGGTYRVVLSNPCNGALNLRADGVYDAFVKGPDGKILSVARLKKVGPSLISSLSTLAGQAMLVEISNQLATIQADLNTVIRLQLAEPLGKVKAALNILRTIHHYQTDQKNALLDAVSKLRDAIGVASQQAIVLITAIPMPPSSDTGRAIWNSSATTHALDRAREAVATVLLGMQALAESEVLLNGNQAAASTLLEWVRTLQRDLNFRRCEQIARMLSANEDEHRRELFWMNVAFCLKQSEDHLAKLLADEAPFRIAFECRLEDLLQVDPNTTSSELDC